MRLETGPPPLGSGKLAPPVLPAELIQQNSELIHHAAVFPLPYPPTPPHPTPAPPLPPAPPPLPPPPQAAQDVLAEKWAQEEAAAAAAAGASKDAQGAVKVRLRKLRGSDLLAALELVKPSTSRAGEYQVGQYARSGAGAGPAEAGLGAGGGLDVTQLLLAVASAMAGNGGANGIGAAGRSSGSGGGGGTPAAGGGAGTGAGAGVGGLGAGLSDEQLKALGLLLLSRIQGSNGFAT